MNTCIAGYFYKRLTFHMHISIIYSTDHSHPYDQKPILFSYPLNSIYPLKTLLHSSFMLCQTISVMITRTTIHVWGHTDLNFSYPGYRNITWMCTNNHACIIIMTYRPAWTLCDPLINTIYSSVRTYDGSRRIQAGVKTEGLPWTIIISCQSCMKIMHRETSPGDQITSETRKLPVCISSCRKRVVL